jgi:hypothetical protein
MNQIPADDSDSPAVSRRVASMIAAARRSNEFFESRRPLAGQTRVPSVTQMTQEEQEEIYEDSSSDSSAPPPPVKRIKPSTSLKKKTPVVSTSTSSTNKAAPSPPKTGEWMGRLGTKKSTPVRKRRSKRVQNALERPGSKSSHQVSTAQRTPTMLKLQPGALVKKNLRLSILHHSKMAMTFGTVLHKLTKSRRWHVTFENGDSMALLPSEFELVANDNKQKKLCFSSPTKKMTLKTPQEAHIAIFTEARKLGKKSTSSDTNDNNTSKESSTCTSNSNVVSPSSIVVEKEETTVSTKSDKDTTNNDNGNNGITNTNNNSTSNTIKLITPSDDLMMEYLDKEDEIKNTSNNLL